MAHYLSCRGHATVGASRADAARRYLQIAPAASHARTCRLTFCPTRSGRRTSIESCVDRSGAPSFRPRWRRRSAGSMPWVFERLSPIGEDKKAGADAARQAAIGYDQSTRTGGLSRSHPAHFSRYTPSKCGAGTMPPRSARPTRRPTTKPSLGARRRKDTCATSSPQEAVKQYDAMMKLQARSQSFRAEYGYKPRRSACLAEFRRGQERRCTQIAACRSGSSGLEGKGEVELPREKSRDMLLEMGRVGCSRSMKSL